MTHTLMWDRESATVVFAHAEISKKVAWGSEDNQRLYKLEEYFHSSGRKYGSRVSRDPNFTCRLYSCLIILMKCSTYGSRKSYSSCCSISAKLDFSFSFLLLVFLLGLLGCGIFIIIFLRFYKGLVSRLYTKRTCR